MKKLGASGQKMLKILHLIMAGLWIGGAIGLLLMVFALDGAQSGGELHGYDRARQFVDDWLVIPGAMGCLATGLLLSWLTPWGFFRHRWVAVKWLLTVACIIFGTFALGPTTNDQPILSAMYGLGALIDPEYASNRLCNLTGGTVQVAAIVFMVVISTLKPWKRKAGGTPQPSGNAG
ncbi:MAG: DUF2269 family protein [Desulfovibrio sp.]|jgi:hypothetical protein|nr:DUF2269 family protein [Desulfovibrio sp.]